MRLAAVGGRQVRAELEGVGEAGARGFGRLTREMEAANQRMDAFWRRARVAATAATAALAAGAGAMIRSGLQVIDNQAKLAQSLDTTVESIQVLERAGELAGVAMSGIEQATKDLIRRLSQAATGTGPAADALKRLGLSAADLLALPLDERVGRINQAITAFVPAAERAAVAGQLFGEEGSIAMARIDTATLRQATADVHDFGVVVSEQDADRIERTNDAVSRLGLIWRGVSNQLAVAAAPALEAIANGLAEIARRTGPLGQAIGVVFDQIGRLAATAAAFAGFMAGRWVAGLVAGAVSVRGLATTLVFLRGALVRTGIGALVVGAGELIYQFGRLASATGGIGNALGLLGQVAREVWSRMGTGLDALVAHAGAAGLELRAAIADALDAALRAVVRFGNGALNTFRGAFAAMRAIWSRLPTAIGDLAFQAANALIAGVEAMLNGVGRRVNGFLRDINAGLEALGLDRRIGLVGELSLGRVANPFAGAAAEAGASAREAFAAAFAGEPIVAPDLGLGAYADEVRNTAAELRQVGEALTALATAPLASVAALREAMQAAGESTETAADATDRLNTALAAVGGGDGAGTGSSSSGSAGQAAAAGEKAGDAIAGAADRAATGWAAVSGALTRYAGEAMAVGRQLGDAMVSAFRGVEDVFARFVTKGKLDFRGLADSILTFEKVAEFAPADIEAGATGFFTEAGGFGYDASDDSVIFQVRLSDGGTPGTIYTLKWRTGMGIVWATPVPIQINYEGPFSGQGRIEGQRWTVMRSTRLVQLDTATGAVVLDETWPPAVSERGAQAYDAVSDTHLVRGESGWARLFPNRGGGEGEALSAIVADLCGRAGLGLADTDLAELTPTVPGYVIGRQTSVRSAIEPLAQAHFFDAAESDDLLRFRSCGREPVAGIGADMLLPLDEQSGESWRERRTQEVELPERVSVVHMDRDADYSQGTQSAKRAALPLATMHSRHQTSLELALAIDATTAKRIAARTLASAWIERSTYEAELPPDWLRLDPTDVVDVEFATGSAFRTRITRLDVGADFSLALTGVSEMAAAYVSNVEADGGSGRPAQVVGAQAATRLILPDLPLLRDTDDAGGTGSRLYFGMGGFGGPNWPGAALYRSADASVWNQVGRGLSEAAWGATANALGPPASPFATDDMNHLRLFMTTGGERLESVTQAALVNGSNAALVLKANGEPEIVQFRDVTPNPDGSYTLTGLLRGRRGTDVFVDGHAAGELFVLLDPDDVETMLISLGDLDRPRSWRAVGFGTLFEEAETLVASHSGRDLKPYAPWDVRAALTGSPADITLSWLRRTRIGGELKDGTALVPLGETLEEYEVDILDAPGGTVLRTLASTGPSVVYANAVIVADFGAVPANLSVAVYQLSAVAGRGFPRVVTLPIG